MLAASWRKRALIDAGEEVQTSGWTRQGDAATFYMKVKPNMIAKYLKRSGIKGPAFVPQLAKDIVASSS